MRRFFNNLHFRSKIIWIFGVLLFLSMSFTGVSYYRYTARDVEANFMVGAEDVLAQLMDTLDLRFLVIKQRAQGMLTNNTFVLSISDYLNLPSDLNAVEAMGVVSSFLRDLETGESLIHSTFIHTDKADYDNFSRIRDWDFCFEESEYYKCFLENPQSSIRWFTPREDEIFKDTDIVIPYVRRFSVDGYNKGKQYLVIQLKKTELEHIMEGKYAYFDKLLILDADGNQIAGSDEVDVQKLLELSEQQEAADEVSSGVYDQDEESYLIFSGTLEETGWRIFGLKSRQSLLGSLEKQRFVIEEMTGAAFLIGLLFLLLVSHQMTSGLRRLEKRMSCVQSGDFNIRFFHPYRDEIGSLARSFNCMVEEIQRLVEKQEETIQELKQERDHAAEIQKQKRKAELKALQAQINPHFLYNTLNAITWQAADQGAEEISILSNSLGKFFRISLSRGEEIISLREELEHVSSYLDIQSIRYRSRLNYEIDVPDEWNECRVLKLILQPLAENSIYHGIKEKNGAGMIRISAQQAETEYGKALRLTVWDDGAGIPKEKLEEINRALSKGETKHSDGYGIFNVNERIRLYFGENYGLSYESEEGLWTRAILLLPKEGMGD